MLRISLLTTVSCVVTASVLHSADNDFSTATTVFTALSAIVSLTGGVELHATSDSTNSAKITYKIILHTLFIVKILYLL